MAAKKKAKKATKTIKGWGDGHAHSQCRVKGRKKCKKGMKGAMGKKRKW